MTPSDLIHENQPVMTFPEGDAVWETAQGALILLHGRGSDPMDILGLADYITAPLLVYLAPFAAGREWYPNRFIMPIETNEPHLTSALRTVGNIVASVQKKGIPAERIGFLGFSQGACLAAEFVARNPHRYAGLFVLSGGLIGAPGTVFSYPGALAETPVFLGCSDSDPHIPLWRVQESTAAFKALGGAVTERIYPRMGHTINDDEISMVNQLLGGLALPSAQGKDTPTPP